MLEKMEQVLQRAAIDKSVGRPRPMGFCPLILNLQCLQNFAMNEILDKKWKMDSGKRKVTELSQ
jgi:hypothetical protein